MKSQPLTIPQSLASQGDLVVIPRKEYETLQERPRAVREVPMTAAQRRDLKKAREEFARGEYITLEELRHELGIASKKKTLRKPCGLFL